MRVSFLVIFLVALLNSATFSQSRKLDSLKTELGKAKGDSLKIKALYNLLNVSIFSNADTTIHYAKKLIDLSARTNNAIYHSSGYYYLGNAYSVIGNHDLATEMILKSKKIAEDGLREMEEFPEDTNKVFILNGLRAKAFKSYGNEMMALNEYHAALKSFDSAAVINEQMKDYLSLGGTYIDMANLLTYTYKYPEAIEYYYKGIKIADEHKNKKMNFKADAYNGLGYVFDMQNKYDEALEKYKSAAEILKAMDFKSSLAISLGNIAGIYQKKGDPEKAIQYYREALQIAESGGDKAEMIYAYAGIGDVYLSQKKYGIALDNFEKGLVLFEEVDDANLLADVLLKMGKTYMGEKKYPDAEKKIKEGLEHAEQTGNYGLVAEAHHLLYELDTKKGNYKGALEHYKSFKEFTDSIVSQETNDKLIRSGMTYEFEKIQALEMVEKEKKKLELDAAQFQKRIITIALIALLILFILTYFNLRKTSKLNKVINSQKRELEKVNDELGLSLTQKETLLKEIHHRVKNNLQFISSLLSLQSHGSQNPELLSIMKEGKSRIKSMALIHQMLYQNEDFSKLNFQFYIEQLTAELYAGYTNKERPVAFKIETNNISFDIDTSIPLGLIISELVTNSLKYAYVSEGGTITITLQQLEDESFKLTVRDSGKGLPPDFNISNSQSLGLKLVKMLSQQLRGTLEMDSADGTSISITFKAKLNNQTV